MKTLALGVCLLGFLVTCRSQVDDTLVASATGAAVVEAVVAKIQEACIFEDDMFFLRRMAFVESADGTSPHGGGSGIWEVTAGMFAGSKTVGATILSAVNSQFGIDWVNLPSSDLAKPLYSGLCARLFLQYLKESSIEIPSSLNGQANYWEDSVTSLSHDGIYFLSQVDQMTDMCDQVLDVAFFLEGSNSIDDAEFGKMVDFFDDMVPELNVGGSLTDNSRLAAKVFSRNSSVQFRFNTYSSVADYQSHVFYHPKDDMRTHKAVRNMARWTFRPWMGVRDFAPDVGVFIIHTLSINPTKTISFAAELHTKGVEVFVLGIGLEGNAAAVTELKAIASVPDCHHLFFLDNFDDFDNFVQPLEKRLCNVCNPPADTTTSIPNGKRRNFCYQLSVTCGLLPITSSSGTADIYLAIGYQPNSARYDSKLSVGPLSPANLFPSSTSGTLYLTVVATSDVTLVFDQFTDCTCPGNAPPVSIGGNLNKCGFDCESGTPCDPLYTDYKYHYPYSGSESKYVQCDAFENCYILPCPPGLVYDDSIQTCNWP